MPAPDFSSIPILDYSKAKSPETKKQFVLDLRHALINVGFLYLSNHSVNLDLINKLVAFLPHFFALPEEEKMRIKMVNSPHFLGYSSLGAELTKGKTDYREQVDIATPFNCLWNSPEDPEYLRLWGPSQWPGEELLPGFKETMEEYLLQVRNLADDFITLFAEALGLPADELSKFYDTPDRMQHRSKLVQYPVVKDGSTNQGVGPHYDAGFLTVLLQASDHPGLQVQNLAGNWIDVPPIPGTFVINIGKALEFATQGVAKATSHRVLSPPADSQLPRYSIPFFHNIGLSVRLTEKKYALKFPEEVLKLRDARGETAVTESVNFGEFGSETSGQVNLIGRVKYRV